VNRRVLSWDLELRALSIAVVACAWAVVVGSIRISQYENASAWAFLGGMLAAACSGSGRRAAIKYAVISLSVAVQAVVLWLNRGSAIVCIGLTVLSAVIALSVLATLRGNDR
jgi:peptidoglycan/LPS O-acetylase OafA/YrhL